MVGQYGPKAKEYVHDVTHEFTHGKLRNHSGRKGALRSRMVTAGLRSTHKARAKVPRR